MLENNNETPGRRMWWILVSIAALIALAWTGILDKHSTEYLDGALLGSGAIYATARGINALVSVLQGTEMNALVITFSVGELLDPVNDLIERFSGVMLFAIGSLAIQKILLEVVSHATFNILLTLLGVGVLATSVWGSPRQYRAITRFFIVTAVIRFSLAAVVLANYWTDTIFLNEREAQQYEAMKSFQGELDLIGSRAGLNADLTDDIKQLEMDIALKQQTKENEQQELYLNGVRLEQAEIELEVLDNRSYWDKIFGKNSAELQEKKDQISKLENSIEANQHLIEAINETLEALDDRLECLEQQAGGESCGIADSMSRAMAALDVKKRIEALSERVDEFATNLINLLMSLVLKSILLPILFLYLLLHSVKSLFEMNR